MFLEFYFRAVVFAKYCKNDCSFFVLRGLPRNRSPPVLDFDKFQNSEFGGNRNERKN